MKRFLIILCVFTGLILTSGCASKNIYTRQELEYVFQSELNMSPEAAVEYLPFIPTEKTAELIKSIPIKSSNIQAAGILLMRAIAGEKGFNVSSHSVDDTTATFAKVAPGADPIENINKFIALARQAGLEAVYVKAGRNEGYNSDELFNYVENHICAGLKSGDKVMLFDFINNPTVYKSYKVLSDIEAVANIMNLRGVQYDRQYLLTGKPEFKQKAVSSYRLAIRLVPDFALAMNNLAVIDIRDGNMNEAEALLNQSLKADDLMNVSRYNLAEIALRSSDPAKAIDLLEESVEKSPRDPYTNYRLGMIFFTQKKTDEAANRFKRAISLKKNYLEPRLSLISLLIAQGRLNDAETLLQDSKTIFPENEKLRSLGESLTAKEEEIPEE